MMQILPYFTTPPLHIVDLPADEQHCNRYLMMWPPRMIILHASAGTDSRAWLSTDPDSNVSVHRLIRKDGTIYKIVPDDLQAHHAGYSQIGATKNLNPYSLGIELENMNTGRDPYPTIQLEHTADQCAEWIGAYGPIPILGHAQVDGGKSDPAGFPWREFGLMLLERIALYEINKDYPRSYT